MVPRALYTRDVIWVTGSTWGCVLAGWGVMLSLFLGTDAATGARYIDGFAFGALGDVLPVPRRGVAGGRRLSARRRVPRRLEAQGMELQGGAGEQPRTEIKKSPKKKQRRGAPARKRREMR